MKRSTDDGFCPADESVFMTITMSSGGGEGGQPKPESHEFPTKTPPTTPTLKSLNLRSSSIGSGLFDYDVRSQLEEEAVEAVREFSYAVQSVCISEMLPRTSELLFLNLTTLEGKTYCIELTAKGWRIASNRADCMNGDFRQFHIHTQYFESLNQLLDSISPSYRQRFGGKLAEKLSNLSKNT
ncbi:hypothetical protein KIN20_000741 [Parelaphostrongylus tenuis]|uniref:GSKIP domain-containing protein n=1 Tax=Parelaphostrongylus tenuis TaxID=148309 RepID=A0AAD5QFS4_PARTN|nr:hypothetical protein KIN20_000741 [Parelaphostrongylus tenuis]